MAGVVCSPAVSGCLSPLTLNRAVTTYDHQKDNTYTLQAFLMLYLLFETTVSEVPRVGVPSIIIAK